MIFICAGTQIYQFDRLFKKIDELILSGEIKDEVFAQTGTLIDYYPKHFKYEQYLSHEEFDILRKKADLIISHGGTGALIGACKAGKNVIAVPRLAKYGEHLDDHQLQIVQVLENQGYIRAVYEIDDLGKTIKVAMMNPIHKIYPSKSKITEIIIDYIDSL